MEIIDINGNTVINNVEKDELMNVLKLLIINNNLSAHPTALRDRQQNRAKAINILRKILNISDKEEDKLYEENLNDYGGI